MPGAATAPNGLHGGIVHLCFNMSWLILISMILVPVLGQVRFLTAYLLTGLLASGASCWWNTATISVGASGAVFGLAGIMLAFILKRAFPQMLVNELLGKVAFFIGVNLVVGFLVTGVDNAAHLGGLVPGLLVGLLLRPKETENF